MALLNYATFKELLNSTFRVKLDEPIPGSEGMDAGPAGSELRLAEAEERDDGQCERFSLIFHGPARHFLPQKLYTLTHDTLGEQQIFLVPVGENVEGEGDERKVVGYRYQAIFNRFKKHH